MYLMRARPDSFDDAFAPRKSHANVLGFTVNGNTKVSVLADFYGLKVPAIARDHAVADYVVAFGKTHRHADARVPLGSIHLIPLGRNDSTAMRVLLDFSRPDAHSDNITRLAECIRC